MMMSNIDRAGVPWNSQIEFHLKNNNNLGWLLPPSHTHLGLASLVIWVSVQSFQDLKSSLFSYFLNIDMVVVHLFMFLVKLLTFKIYFVFTFFSLHMS